MPRYVTAPHTVIACDLEHAVVVVNYASGKVLTLLGPSGRWWCELAHTGDLSATTALAGEAGGKLAKQLHGAGILRTTASPQPWPVPISAPTWKPSWGTTEIPFALKPFSSVPTSWGAAAAGVLASTLAYQHVGLRHRRMARMVRLAHAATASTRPAASTEMVLRAVHAIRRVALFSPARSACLEESVAAVALLALLGYGARWCHGLTTDPITLHAWVETLDGHAPTERAPEHCARLYVTPRPQDTND